jgi:serine/threonine protein kinase
MSAISYSSFQRDFRFQQNLGKGNYSTVNQVLHNVDSRTYAHKITELSSIDDFVHCFNEIETLKTIDDDHLAKVLSPLLSSTTTTAVRTSRLADCRSV